MKWMISVLFTLFLMTGLFAEQEEEIEVSCKVENNKCMIVIIKDGEEKKITISLDHLDILDDFLEDFEIDDSKPWLGVYIQPLTKTLREHLKVRGSEGILVNKVVKGSPADKAELKAGDVILSVDREEIEDLEDLVEIIQEQEPGDEVTIRIVRDGRRKTVKVTLDSREVGPSKRMHWFSHGQEEDFPRSFKFKHVLPDCHEDLESLKEELNELREELEQLKRELKPAKNP